MGRKNFPSKCCLDGKKKTSSGYQEQAVKNVCKEESACFIRSPLHTLFASFKRESLPRLSERSELEPTGYPLFPNSRERQSRKSFLGGGEIRGTRMKRVMGKAGDFNATRIRGRSFRSSPIAYPWRPMVKGE